MLRASSIRIRQPLSRALAGLPAGTALPQELLDDISDELNVTVLQPLEAGSGVIDIVVKPNFRELGKRFGKQTQHVAIRSARHRSDGVLITSEKSRRTPYR